MTGPCQRRFPVVPRYRQRHGTRPSICRWWNTPVESAVRLCERIWRRSLVRKARTNYHLVATYGFPSGFACAIRHAVKRCSNYSLIWRRSRLQIRPIALALIVCTTIVVVAVAIIRHVNHKQDAAWCHDHGYANYATNDGFCVGAGITVVVGARAGVWTDGCTASFEEAKAALPGELGEVEGVG
jgi:hypothetical protein